MPNIVMASETDKCYKAKVGDTYICFTANETINYLGQDITGEKLYELLTNTGL